MQPINSYSELQAVMNAITEENWYGLAIPVGWWRLVAETHEKIVALYPDYKIWQIKEKFGSLRYYCTVENEDLVVDIIRDAERKSMTICQACGGAGKLTDWKTDHIAATLCKRHLELRDNGYEYD